MGPALRIFEALRIPRLSAIRNEAIHTRDRWHLEDGEVQKDRDKNARGEISGCFPSKSLCILTDPCGQEWLYGYDVEKEIFSTMMFPYSSMQKVREEARL